MAYLLLLLCMITITNILFGDYLIEKYKLNEKHYILSKFLRFRGTFKKYSLAMNLLLVYSVLIAMLIYNTLPFIIV